MRVNYRMMMLWAGLFMGLLGFTTATQGDFEGRTVVVMFEFVAAVLLFYWAIFS